MALKNKIEHGWSILCSGLSIDQRTNNLTLFNVIEQIKIPRERLIDIEVKDLGKKKAIPMVINLVTLWRRVVKEGVKVPIEVHFIDPDGIVRQKADYIVEMQGGVVRNRSQVAWGPIRSEKSGIYTFRSFFKKGDKLEIAGDAYLDVKILDKK